MIIISYMKKNLLSSSECTKRPVLFFATNIIKDFVWSCGSIRRNVQRNGDERLTIHHSSYYWQWKQFLIFLQLFRDIGQFDIFILNRSWKKINFSRERESTAQLKFHIIFPLKRCTWMGQIFIQTSSFAF